MAVLDGGFPDISIFQEDEGFLRESEMMIPRGCQEKITEKSQEEVDEDVEEGSCVEVVRWERFLPRMVLRVLLVEPDDSTRRIISALLRKCSYRVAAVSDGLKAWETIRARPQSIDIIMTEVDLPSISGYALLALVMEHEVCRNIPVIMMSSQDSISTVFKYMLKGVGDFLVKPIRSNELRNIWQHVWRRQSLLGEKTTCKAVASFENNAACNYSSDCASPKKKHKECSEKEVDTQSSCTTPYVEAESAYTPNMLDPTSLKSLSSSCLSNMGEADHKTSGALEREMCILHGRTRENLHGVVSEFPSCDEVYFVTPSRRKEDRASIQGIDKDGFAGSDMLVENEFFSSEVISCDDECNELPSRAIDLIATIDIKPKFVKRGFSYEKVESTTDLEFSLGKMHPSSNAEGTDEMKPLNHSSASAFSLYTSRKIFQPPFHVPSTDTCRPDGGPCKFKAPSLNKISENECTFQTQVMSHVGNGATPVLDDSGQIELPFTDPRFGTVPVADGKFDNVGVGDNHAVPSMFCAQYGIPTGWNSRQACNEGPGILKQADPETTNNSMEQSEVEKNVTKPSDPPRHNSPAAPHSTNSTLCNETSDYDWQEGVEKMAPFEISKDGRFFSHEGFKGPPSHSHSHCMSQREAALTKFRLKRKDRCYSKKVRYQSRKRLAEQRPRIKGQFVRQIEAYPLTTEARCS